MTNIEAKPDDTVRLTDDASTTTLRARWETDPEDSLGMGAPHRVLIPAFFVVDTSDDDGAVDRAAAEAHAINGKGLLPDSGLRLHLCQDTPNTHLVNPKLADPRSLAGFVGAQPAEEVSFLQASLAEVARRAAEHLAGNDEAFPEWAALLKPEVLPASPERDPTEVTLRFKISNRLCSDTLCCAFEGGTGYWAILDETTATTGEEAKALGLENGDWLSARMSDTENWETPEDAAFEPFVADFALVRRGIQRLLSEGGVRSDIIEAVRNAVADDDASHIDADAADAIVQLGAFNELVFG